MVQGPGGNTSFKNAEKMWVKASGTRLSEALDREIFAEVSVLDGAGISTEAKLRPSIEKDFHLLVPFSYVIHTHSLNAMSLAINKATNLEDLENAKIAFVPYARPGKDLCSAISEVVDFNRHASAILRNHGFLTWGNSMEEAYNRLLTMESNHPQFDVLNQSTVDNNLMMHPKAITPDYAVFLSPYTQEEIELFKNENSWQKEMYLVSKLAISIASPENVEYLSEDEVHELQNWEAEKFRRANN